MQQQQDTKLSLLHEKIQTCLFSLWLLKVSYHVLCLLNVAKTRTTYIDVSSVVRMLDPELCRSLQGLHAFEDGETKQVLPNFISGNRYRVEHHIIITVIIIIINMAITHP